MDLTYLIPLSGVVALIFVFIKNSWVSKKPVGNPKMEKIAKHILGDFEKGQWALSLRKEDNSRENSQGSRNRPMPIIGIIDD